MVVLKMILRLLSNICYILIGVYFLVSCPSFFGYNPLIVLSGSMTPTYRVGTVIYYHQISESDIKEGDVITFSNDSDEYITHRVTEIKDGLYETQGDANLSPDPKLVDYSRVKGKIAKISIPIIGYYIKFVNENLYMVPVVVVILLLEFLVENLKIFNKEKEDKNES